MTANAERVSKWSRPSGAVLFGSRACVCVFVASRRAGKATKEDPAYVRQQQRQIRW